MGVLVRLWVLAVVLRLLNAATVSTYFVPDEHWQVQEVAYSLVFRAGYRTWEWIPASACSQPDGGTIWAHAVSAGPLRSILPVLIYLPSYWIVRLTGVTSPWVVSLAPRATQALFAATGDVYAAAIAAAAMPGAGPMAFLLSLLSPWLWLTSTRTLANSTEAVLLLVALYFWPLDLTEPRRREKPVLSLLVASLALLVRPSTGVVFAYLGLRTLLSAGGVRSALAFLLLSATVVSGVLGTSVLVDSYFHAEAALPVLSFGARNLVQGLATFYGSAPWHFYLTQALPLLGGAGLLLALQGAGRALQQPTFASVRPGGGDPTLLRVSAEVGLVYLVLHSVLGHKEHRFVQPIAYLAPILAACQSAFRGGRMPRTLGSTWRSFPALLRAALVLAFAAGVYLATVHQRGQALIVQDIASLARKGEVRSVGWLMPCHSTPWHASLHTPSLYDTRGDGHSNSHGDGDGEDLRRTWFLTCSPPGSCTSEGANPSPSSPQEEYFDLADEFHGDPVRWLQTAMATSVDPSFPPARAGLFRASSAAAQEMGDRIPWPSHIVLFQSLRSSPGVEQMLRTRGYDLLSTRWNAPVTDDARRTGRIETWAWRA